MKYLLMVVLLFSFNQVMAAKGFLDGNELLEMCEAWANKTGSLKGNVCIGYVEGVVDTYFVLARWDGSKKRFCLPNHIEIHQLVRVVIKHLQENPKNLHYSASGLVLTSISAAFPCE